MQSQITKSQLYAIFKDTATLNTPLVNQKEYLVDGQFKPWTGPFTEVKSAICKPDSNGNLAPIVLGNIPKTGLAEAFECLQSAEKAYENGFGEWPMLSVESRIFHVERFVGEMLKLRSEVVLLLQWEKIGRAHV